MKRWPVIRHVRYLWLKLFFWWLRREAGMEQETQERLYLKDVWEGRA